jgi:hypothetical protein
VAIATLTIDFIAKLASLEASFAKATTLSEKTAKRMEGAFNGVRNVFVGLAAAISVREITQAFTSIVDGIDSIGDMATSVGSTVENLSALEDVILRSGESYDVATQALVKMNKELADAKPGSDTEKIIKGIGLSVKELRDLDPVEALQRVAKALQTFTDDQHKARIVQQLFGKQAKEIAPILKELASAGELNAKVTTAQAQAAEDFKKQMAGLQKNIKDAARDLVSDWLPAINQAFELFSRARAQGLGIIDAAQVAAAGSSIDNLNAELEQQYQLLSKIQNGGWVWGTESREESEKRAQKRIEYLRKEIQLREALKLGEGTYSNEAVNGRGLRSLKALGDQLDDTSKKAKRTKEELALFRAATADMFQGDAEGREFIAKQIADDIEHLDRLLGRDVIKRVETDLARLDKAFFDEKIDQKQYDEAKNRLFGIGAAAKESTPLVEQLGLTMASSLGQLFDIGADPINIFKALASDVAKLIIQLEILEPMMQSIRDFSKQSKSGGGSFLGLLIDGIGKFVTGGGGAPNSAGAANGEWDILPSAGKASAAGGASYTFNYNIGATYGDAALNKALLDNQRATIAQLQDMQARGRG